MAPDELRINSLIMRRQEILDWLHTHPHASTKEIAKGLNRHLRTVGDHLRMMALDKEVVGTQVFEAKYRFLRYTAVVTVTNNLPVSLAEAKKIERTRKRNAINVPGYYRHYSTAGEHPILNQGGQGAVGIPRTSTYLELAT